MIPVDARPYTFELVPDRTMLVVIDMQRDFIEPGGFGESRGNDVSRLRSIIPTTAALIALFRKKGWPILHTREAHRPDLSDCPPSKINRGRGPQKIGDPGPMGRLLIAGEPGNQIVPELAPIAGEMELDKPGKGMFWATGIHELLQEQGITHLIFAGVTTDVCVQTSMREANDRGFECLLLEDCCGATDLSNHRAAIEMIQMQGGVFGAVSDSAKLLAVLS